METSPLGLEGSTMARRRYPPEFRQQLIALARTGRTPESLAKDFEPSAPTIRNWVTRPIGMAGRAGMG